MLKKIFLLIVLLLPFTASEAALSHDARLEWMSMRSSHFTVHYHQGEEQLAQQAIAIAERVHERLVPLFGWSPQEPTEIVLSDQLDFHNGSATMFPANRMVIYVSTPDAIESLEDHAGAMENVILHEYIHILQLDKASGSPKDLRNFLGRFPLLFPAAFQPAWFLEGLATHGETDAGRSIGRGQSSYFDMMMRAESACGLKPLRQINQRIATWPAGHVPYLYGVNYYQFIEQRYGADKIQMQVDYYSNNLIPFAINTNSRQLFGDDLDGLWPQFESYVQERHQPVLSRIREQGVVAGVQQSHHGYNTGMARAMADGSVIYLRSDGASEPALLRLRPGSKEPELIANVHPAARFDLHPEAGIVIAMPELHRNANIYFDLYHVDIDSGKQRRLTTAGRYRYATWSPDGQRIIAVHNGLAKNALHLLDAGGRFIEELWQGEADTTLTAPDWSPEGGSVVLSIWRPEGGWNLELFDLQQRRFKQLTQQHVIEAQPQFTADGRAVLFSADYDGIYNLQRLDLESGAITTLTRVEAGAFMPSQATTDGPIYYTGYDCDGFDIYKLEQPQALASAGASAPQGASGTPLPPAPVPQGLLVSDYSPHDGLRPRWWFPHLAIESGRTELGVMTAATDAINRHIYMLDAAYDFRNDLFVGAIDYVYDRYDPIFKLHGERLNQSEHDGNDNLTRLRSNDFYMAEVVLPFYSYDRRISFHAAVLTERESDAWRAATTAPQPSLRDNLIGVAAVYDSTRRYPLSVSRANGLNLQLIAEDSDAIGSSHYSGTIYAFDGRAFAGLGRQHVLALRFATGYGDEASRRFKLGGSSSDGVTPYPLDSAHAGSPFNKRNYALRGYPSGLAELTGNRMALASMEWRFPIKRIERGIMVPPVAVNQIHGGLFVEGGDAWQPGQSRHYANSAGIEITVEVIPFYGLLFDTLAIRSGYAHGYDAGGEDQFYMQLGAGF